MTKPRVDIEELRKDAQHTVDHPNGYDTDTWAGIVLQLLDELEEARKWEPPF